jgi:hypothetical protein
MLYGDIVVQQRRQSGTRLLRARISHKKVMSPRPRVGNGIPGGREVRDVVCDRGADDLAAISDRQLAHLLADHYRRCRRVQYV